MYRKYFVPYLLCVAIFSATFGTAFAADSTGAGFVAESVFFSHTPLVEGSNVFIYASVLNTSADAFSGKVVFTDAGIEIGSLAVTLAPGEARIVSISWTPTTGSHAISAALQSVNGTPVASSGALAPNAKITVSAAAKPETPPAQPDTTVVVPSSDIQKAVEYVSPPVAKTLQPAFVTVDKAREGAAAFIDNQIKQTKNSLIKQAQGSVAGTSAPSFSASSTPSLAGFGDASSSSDSSAPASSGSFTDTAWTWALNAYLYLLAAVRFGVANPMAFYPVIILLFFWGMYKMYKHMTRPRFDQF